MNLIVGDVFKAKGRFKKIIDKALAVVKWFNNHGRALGLLRRVMMEKMNKVLALILPIITRWTSHYLSVDRLLELEDCLIQVVLSFKDELITCAGKTSKVKAVAQRIIKIIRSGEFWDDLRMSVQSSVQCIY